MQIQQIYLIQKVMSVVVESGVIVSNLIVPIMQDLLILQPHLQLRLVLMFVLR